jgi:hypothetical protein
MAKLKINIDITGDTDQPKQVTLACDVRDITDPAKHKSLYFEQSTVEMKEDFELEDVLSLAATQIEYQLNKLPEKHKFGC